MGPGHVDNPANEKLPSLPEQLPRTSLFSLIPRTAVATWLAVALHHEHCMQSRRLHARALQ